MGFPGGSLIKNPPANAGDLGSIPGLRSSPGGGNGNPLQYSCLENSIDRGAWRSMGPRGVRHDSATKRAHTHICTHTGMLLDLFKFKLVLFRVL